MSDPRRVYWDSSVFLAWLLPEPERKLACREVLRPAEEGELLIVTSAVTLTEVIKLGKNAPPLPPEDERKISRFFKQPYLVIASTTQFIAEEARHLIWQFPKLKPKDSLHLATARFHGIREIHSFDGDHLALDGEVGEPPIKICHPQTLQPQIPFPELDEDDEGSGEEEPSEGNEELGEGDAVN